MTTTTHEQAEKNAAAYISLQAKIAELNEQLDEIKTWFATHLPEGKTETSAGNITVSPNRRLNTKKFLENYPVVSWPTFYKTTPDTTAIKKELGENEYHRYCTSGAPRITVK